MVLGGCRSFLLLVTTAQVQLQTLMILRAKLLEETLLQGHVPHCSYEYQKKINVKV